MYLHHPEYGEERSCSCRKPAPGLLLRAAADLSIDLLRSWMIGDKLIDVEAGYAGNVATILVLTGHGAREITRLASAQTVAENLLSACRHMLNSVTSSEQRWSKGHGQNQ
ncbi:HAD hydrolase-like protein [Alphaproteobacteria bacterium]|nr:HAD hydrolase-like protein [Alphaproteobacteria bacterium]